jgi:hypothetical protein
LGGRSRYGLSGKIEEAALMTIEVLKFAGMDLINPSVEVESAGAKAGGDRRVGAKMLKLGDDVSPRQSA